MVTGMNVVYRNSPPKLAPVWSIRRKISVYVLSPHTLCLPDLSGPTLLVGTLNLLVHQARNWGLLPSLPETESEA